MIFFYGFKTNTKKKFSINSLELISRIFRHISRILERSEIQGSQKIARKKLNKLLYLRQSFTALGYARCDFFSEFFLGRTIFDLRWKIFEKSNISVGGSWPDNSDFAYPTLLLQLHVTCQSDDSRPAIVIDTILQTFRINEKNVRLDWVYSLPGEFCVMLKVLFSCYFSVICFLWILAGVGRDNLWICFRSVF